MLDNAAGEAQVEPLLVAGSGARAAAERAMALTAEFDSPLERRLAQDLLAELRQQAG